ncbi:MAG TPA: SDR family oxidoreductase [Acidimicrobiales bacterium]|nr:SDR family oxidoreductase [Acidimicrobiales bacterium]
MDLRLDGKVALVTGGSRGIGRAIAARLAEAGAAVMLSSRKADALEEAAASIAAATSSPGRAGAVGWYAAHAGDPEAAAACVEATVERFGSLDVLVNNAATNPYYGPVIDIDLPRADKTLQVNQLAPLVWSQCAWRASMAAGGGAIINVASIGAMSVEPGIGWYNVTKAALAHLTRQLAYELGPGVRVNALAPGLVRTDFARALWEGAGDAVARRLPLKRLGEPDDVAKAALFLASDAAAWMTGHVLVVDGGAMAMPSGGV